MGLVDTVVAKGILVIVFALGILVDFITLGVLIADVVSEKLIVVGHGNGHIVIVFALGKWLINTIINNGVFAVVVKDVAVLDVLITVIIVTLSKGLVILVMANGILIVAVGDVTLLGMIQVPSLSLFFDGLHFGTLNKPNTMESCSPNVLARSCVVSHPPSITLACFWWFVVCKISNGGHLRPSSYFIFVFFCSICRPKIRNIPPPYMLLPGHASSSSLLPLLQPTIG